MGKKKKKKMKKIILILITLILVNCSPIKQSTQEIEYIGNFCTWQPNKKTTKIITTEKEFYIYGIPEYNIPLGAKCYIIYKTKRIAITNKLVYILYLKWETSNKEYLLKQNFVTNYIY